MEQKYITLLKKIKALADKGIDGEKKNAENLLRQIMEKYSISESDIESDTINEYFFNVKDDKDWLFFQIVICTDDSIKIYGKFNKTVIRSFKIKGNYMIECTADKYIDIEARFDMLSKAFDREFKVFQRAFCVSNDLLINSPNHLKLSDLSDEERDIVKRGDAMSLSVKSEQYRRQLSDGVKK